MSKREHFVWAFYLDDSKLLARMNIHRFDASLALHVAAPVEFALATLLHRRLVSVVASAAAHEIASVHSGRSPIARPPIGPCTKGSQLKIVTKVKGQKSLNYPKLRWFCYGGSNQGTHPDRPGRWPLANCTGRSSLGAVLAC